MRTPMVSNALVLTTGTIAGIALTITAQRWTPTALWWLFGNGR